ncbi:MAG: PLP-dependent aspartate aminotransferase family protein [Thermoanaerobaculia bacterium]|nr:PLP-dependent aspartate aminotransferase family protein [Thermoanaerobaculia bacterium]
MIDAKSLKPGSLVIHGGQSVEPVTGAVVPPIFTSATYAQSSPGEHKGFEYTRSHNPTRYALERLLATLEGSEITLDEDPSLGGFAFSSGLAAMATCLELVEHGARIVASDDLYGGSRRQLSMVRERTQGLEVVYVDMTDLDAFAQAMTPATAMVWVETPTNPMMKIIDLEEVTRIARAASENVLLVCDNTFATPFSQRPFDLGFDVAMHSTTKYINGHSDVVGGALIAKTTPLAEQLRFLQNAIGSVMAPFDASQTLRGAKTLGIRMERHTENATELARFLEAHPRVESVIYPGLDNHPQVDLVKRQMRLAGGMITFCIDGGLAEARRFAESVRIFQLAESLGAVESLVNHPAIMTHASVPAATRDKLGIGDNLLRLSVGIESIEDLVADVEQALESIN